LIKNKMREQLPTYSKIRNRKKPPTLFHYTTPIGLLGISHSKNIWATDIRFLNDKKELHHILDITHSILDDFYKVDDNPEKIRELNYDFIEGLRINLLREWSSEVYVASFTEEGDILSQWRGYCPNGGFSIGFHYDMLSQIATKNHSFLERCVYDLEIQKQMIEELLVSYSKKYVKVMKDNNHRNIDELGNRILDEFLIALFAWAPMFKHKSFKEEKEWRIVCSRFYGIKQEMKFRANELNIVPYIEISLCQSEEDINFKEIFIGPAVTNQSSKDAVSRLLEKNRMPEHSIIFSNAPYRSG